jgi:hypothetical protein
MVAFAVVIMVVAAGTGAAGVGVARAAATAGDGLAVSAGVALPTGATVGVAAGGALEPPFSETTLVSLQAAVLKSSSNAQRLSARRICGLVCSRNCRSYVCIMTFYLPFLMNARWGQRHEKLKIERAI